MSAAFKCDRCKQFNDGKAHAEVIITVYDPGYGPRDDGNRQGSLCSGCHSNLVSTFDHNPQTGKPNR